MPLLAAARQFHVRAPSSIGAPCSALDGALCADPQRARRGTSSHLVWPLMRLQIEELRKFCEDYCLHSMQATGVCVLHEQAKRYNCRRLAEATLQFIIENGDESLGARDSVSLSEASLLAVLQDDDLVCGEATVFDCVERWVRTRATKELGVSGMHGQDASAALLKRCVSVPHD
jgi:hypothetical protein